MTGQSRISSALHAEQALASDPDAMVWLSASAGTGKTFVLAARVLRLLLRGVAPGAILCLTFTTAGAAEMANRINATLAHWVRLPDAALANELKDVAERFDPAAVGNARRLFARVLEARGGGLRIMTIHAFCQNLLASFPLEAGITPGFQPLEGRDQTQLAQQVLADLVTRAEQQGDTRLIVAMQAMSVRLGEDRTQRFLLKAAGAPDVLAYADDVIGDRIAATLGIGGFDAEAECMAADEDALTAIAAMYRGWATKTGAQADATIATWLAADPPARVATIDKLHGIWRTAAGTPPKHGPKDAGFEPLREELATWSTALRDAIATAAVAEQLGAALFVAGRYARAYDAAKRVRGVVDFDDLIRDTAALLAHGGMGEWIRYKLDQATDHILVDEAQDTNTAQWAIIASIAAEFFAGDGARDGAARSLFTVGDYKQAIYGFQGTDPIAYAAARQSFAATAERGGQAIATVALNRSFRSAPAVLDVVDRVVADIGPDAMGIADVAAPHVSHRGGFGSVMLLPPPTTQDDPDRAIDDDGGEEGWAPDVDRRLAHRIARYVKALLDAPTPTNSPGETLRAGDVMILLRSRGALASLIVARLYAAGVAVAGVDRLQLQSPLAVKDLLAAMRFAVQPRDDLTLAALLTSPILGWTQDELFAAAFKRPGSMWDAVRDGPAGVALRAILNDADRISPFAFLETMLSGSLQARAKLVARLGAEARDPIDQLLAAALDFGTSHIPSLQGFIDWFDTNDGEIKRDAAGSGDMVRVMTVHAAKGLQAKLVILADACFNPDDKREDGLDWAIAELGATLPVPRPPKDQLTAVALLAEQAAAADARARSEHSRLLYVALTRAEERLVVTGALGVRTTAKGAPPDHSWYAAVARALAGMAAPTADDMALWAEPFVVHESGTVPRRTVRATAAIIPAMARPEWLDQPAPVEARPARPLAPSAIVTDDVADPPRGGAMQDAARRGVLLHGLFERLPAVPVDRRNELARRWLGDIADADAIIAAAMQVIAAYPAQFAADGLAEAPVAGIVGDRVIAGTVDRLIVRDDGVELIDFKTGRRAPATLSAIPAAHLAQMAAYTAVLRQIFPDRPVRALLLYTSAPVLHELPAALLAEHASMVE